MIIMLSGLDIPLLIKKSGVTILTDPIFSERASPLKNFGPKRLIPPALQIKDIPKIDFVTISHNHYDHLDTRSLKEISALHPDAIFLVPSGDLRLLKKIKLIMYMSLIGGSHSKLKILNLHSLLFSIGLKEHCLIEIKVFGVVGI